MPTASGPQQCISTKHTSKVSAAATVDGVNGHYVSVTRNCWAKRSVRSIELSQSNKYSV